MRANMVHARFAKNRMTHEIDQFLELKSNVKFEPSFVIGFQVSEKRSGLNASTQH